jgi:hypothetical protein
MAAPVEAAGGRKANCFFEVGRREIGSSFPRASSRRISGSEVLFFSVIFLCDPSTFRSSMSPSRQMIRACLLGAR